MEKVPGGEANDISSPLSKVGRDMQARSQSNQFGGAHQSWSFAGLGEGCKGRGTSPLKIFAYFKDSRYKMVRDSPFFGLYMYFKKAGVVTNFFSFSARLFIEKNWGGGRAPRGYGLGDIHIPIY